MKPSYKMKFLIISIVNFLIFVACNKVDKGQLLSLPDLTKKKLYNSLDGLPNDLNIVYRLNLSEKSLTRIPDIIYKMINLQELNLSSNQILNIDSIYLIDKLQILNIGDNRITSLPPNIDKLKHLKNFDFYWNDLTTLPDSFFKLDSLEEIDITSLFSFDFNSNLSRFHLLKQLRKFNIGNNQIPILTLKFGELKNLIEFGYIGQDSINCEYLFLRLDSCPRLKVLHLSRNRITNISKNIVDLDSLENLNLYDNKIKEMPSVICNMKNLKEITLVDNPIDTSKLESLENKMIQTEIIY